MSQVWRLKLFLALIIPFTLPAQTISLKEILSQIEAANPSLRMYDAQIRAQDEAAKGARSWMPPQVSSGFWMTPYNVRRWTPNEAEGMEGMGQYMISLQQMLPNRRRQNAEATYMESMSSVERENRGVTLNELRASAKRNYYEWIVLEKKLSVLDQNERLLDFMLRSAEIRYRNGMDKLNVYYKVKAALGNVRNMRLMLEADVQQKRIALNTVLNWPAVTAFHIDTVYQIHALSSYAVDSAALAAGRSDVRAVEREMELNILRANVERSRLLPEFGVQFDNMFSYGGGPMQFSLMGMVRIPLAPWSAKMYRANIAGIEWQNRALVSQRQMLLNEAAGMAESMRTELDLKQRQLELYESQIIPDLRRNYQALSLAYEQNTEELFMVFDAWEALNMTQLDYLDLLRERLTAQVELERLLELKDR